MATQKLKLYEATPDGILAAFDAEGVFLIPIDAQLGNLTYDRMLDALKEHGEGVDIEVELQSDE